LWSTWCRPALGGGDGDYRSAARSSSARFSEALRDMGVKPDSISPPVMAKETGLPATKVRTPPRVMTTSTAALVLDTKTKVPTGELSHGGQGMADAPIVDPSASATTTTPSRRRISATPEQRAAGLAARAAQRAAWPLVRQPMADDREYLKAILKARGLAHIAEAEPATPVRLKRLLRRAGVRSMVGLWGCSGDGPVGRPLSAEDFIGRNPGMALWWLVAVTLEAL